MKLLRDCIHRSKFSFANSNHISMPIFLHLSFSQKRKKKNLSHVKSEKIYDFGEFIKHLARSGVIVGTNQCWLNKDMQELLHTGCFCPSKGHWRGHAILSCMVHPEKNQFNWSSRHQFLLLTWYILKYLFGSLFQESWPLPAFPK